MAKCKAARAASSKKRARRQASKTSSKRLKKTVSDIASDDERVGEESESNEGGSNESETGEEDGGVVVGAQTEDEKMEDAENEDEEMADAESEYEKTYGEDDGVVKPQQGRTLRSQSKPEPPSQTGAITRSAQRQSKADEDCCCECGKEGGLVTCDGCTNQYHPECAGDDRTFKAISKLGATSWFCAHCKSEQQRATEGGEHHDPEAEDGDDAGLDDSPDPPYTPFPSDAACSSCTATREESGLVVCCMNCRCTSHVPCSGTGEAIADIKTRGFWTCLECRLINDDVFEPAGGDEDDEDEDGEVDAPAIPLDEIDLDHYQGADQGDDETEEEERRKKWPPIRLTPYSVDELSNIGIGKPAVRRPMTALQEAIALNNCEIVYRGIIREHKRWAQRTDMPMNPVVRIVLNQWTEDEWWDYIERSKSRERRIALGDAGKDMTEADFLALPPVTEAELRGWIIYGNHAKHIIKLESRNYGGRATDAFDFAWARLTPYEKSARRVAAGGQPYSAVSHAHAGFAFDGNAENLFRVFSTPPVNEGRIRAHILEGMDTTRMGGFDVDYSGDHWTQQDIDAVLEFLPNELQGMTFNGLNHAHQYRQSFQLTPDDREILESLGVTSSKIKRELNKCGTQKKTCPCCKVDKSTDNVHLWSNNPFLRSLVDDSIICRACGKGWGRKKATMSAEEYVASRIPLLHPLHHLRGTPKQCLCCKIERDVPGTGKISQTWSKNPLDKAVVDDEFVCYLCRAKWREAGQPESIIAQQAFAQQIRNPSPVVVFFRKCQGDWLKCPCCLKPKPMPQGKGTWKSKAWNAHPFELDIPVICLACYTSWRDYPGRDSDFVEYRRAQVDKLDEKAQQAHLVFLRGCKDITLQCLCCQQEKDMPTTGHERTTQWKRNPFPELNSPVVCVACLTARSTPPGSLLAPEEFFARRRGELVQKEPHLEYLDVLDSGNFQCPCCLEPKVMPSSKRSKLWRKSPFPEFIIYCMACYRDRMKPPGNSLTAEEFIAARRERKEEEREAHLVFLDERAGEEYECPSCKNTQVIPSEKSARSRKWMKSPFPKFDVVCKPCCTARQKPAGQSLTEEQFFAERRQGRE